MTREDHERTLRGARRQTEPTDRVVTIPVDAPRSRYYTDIQFGRPFRFPEPDAGLIPLQATRRHQ